MVVVVVVISLWQWVLHFGLHQFLIDHRRSSGVSDSIVGD